MKIIKCFAMVSVLLLALWSLSGCATTAQTVEQSAADSAVVAQDAAVASEAAAQSDDIGRLLDFIAALGALVPVIVVAGPVISSVVDAAKKIGMPPEYAPALNAGLNALVFIIRYFIGPEHEAQFNSAINALYALSPYIIALVISILATVGFHNKLTKAGLGYSATPRKA